MIYNPGPVLNTIKTIGDCSENLLKTPRKKCLSEIIILTKVLKSATHTNRKKTAKTA